MRRLVLAACLAFAVSACAGGSGNTDRGPAALLPADRPAAAAAPMVTVPNAPGPGGPGRGDPLYPLLGNEGYDVTHYDLDLEAAVASQTITAVATIEAVAQRPLTSFNLDFLGLTIDAVEVNGEHAEYVREGSELTILPAAPLPAGRPFTAEIAYGGSPRPRSIPSIGVPLGWRWTYRGAVAVNEPWLAQTWFPANDHPADKATFTFRVTVPDTLAVAANGELTDVTATGGAATYTWVMDRPIATYLVTLVIGTYDLIVEPDPRAPLVRHYLPPDLNGVLPPGLDRSREMIDFFADLFGPYPFATYGVAIVDEFELAVETQTLALFGRRAVGLDDLESHAVHELAHQWFGNSVTPATWGDIWLKEGFATYAEWLWAEHVDGRRSYELAVLEAHGENTGTGLPPPGSPPADDLYTPSIYSRGALTLHALRAGIGDDDFFTVLAAFAAKYRDRSATTADFVEVAEQVSGADLAGLFDRWLYRPEIPALP